MASNTTTPPATAAPLSFMTKLSAEVYHYRPPSETPVPNAPSSGPPPPKLILLASWMGARDMHITKYIRPYQALYPSAEILLVRSEMRHFLRPSRALSELDRVAVPVIRAAYPSSPEEPDPKHPQILIHLFSGGGSFMVTRLRTLLAPSMPSHTLVIDSAPPQYHYRDSFGSVTGGWTPWMRRLLAPLVHLLCAWWWVQHRVLDSRARGPLGRIAAVHNEREGRAKTEVRRTYIYGPGDSLVKWQDVEWHARDAETKGFSVRLEKFEGTLHVAHVRGNEERYWRIARETWEGKSS